jgi:bilirubin oxidase
MNRIVLTALMGFSISFNVAAQHLLQIPDTLSGSSFSLDVHNDSIQLKPGKITYTYGINASRYLGPTLVLQNGDSISIQVTNHIGDTTTMHWHGLHVAPKNDGGPYSMIMDGMTWNPQFTVRNNAATYWYHPHMMAKTAAQAIKGDAGLIIVRDSAEATLNLPRHYGVDDIPLVIQSVELDSTNQFMPRGMVDSIELVNGTDSTYTNLPAQVIRMRLLNGSGERTFNFGFTANKSFFVIGNDNGLLPAPVATTRIRLSPGERAEILIDLGSMNGQTLHLMSYGSELPMGVQGGPTMPMPPGSPLMNSPLNGTDFNVLKINVIPHTTSPVTEIPATLIPATVLSESMATRHRNILMSADSITVMDGPFYFNNEMFSMDRIDYRIPLNSTEIWTLKDSTMVAHPFHLHDVWFYILDRNGVAPDPTEQGRKDVLLIQPNETVRFIARFDDFADTTTPYMYHCHILMHEDDGMMGQFIVGASDVSAPDCRPQNTINIFPNPASDQLNISVGNMAAMPTTITITNTLGIQMFKSTSNNNVKVNTSGWPAGLYNVVINNNEMHTAANVVIY